MTAKSKWTGLTEAEIAALSAKNRAAQKPLTGVFHHNWGNVEKTKPKNPHGPSQKDMAQMEAEITAKLPVSKPKKAAKTQQDVPSKQRSFILTLPWPPSVNNYWRRNKGMGMHISAAGKQFRADVIEKFRNRQGIKGRISVTVLAHPPDRRKRDLDNIFKALLDALVNAGMIEDDGLIDHLTIIRSFVVIPDGLVTVTITTMR